MLASAIGGVALGYFVDGGADSVDQKVGSVIIVAEITSVIYNIGALFFIPIPVCFKKSGQFLYSVTLFIKHSLINYAQ